MILRTAAQGSYANSDTDCNAHGNSEPDTNRDSESYSNTYCYAQSHAKVPPDSASSPDSATLRGES